MLLLVCSRSQTPFKACSLSVIGLSIMHVSYLGEQIEQSQRDYVTNEHDAYVWEINQRDGSAHCLCFTPDGLQCLCFCTN